jgi:DNA-binding protein Fis
MNEELINITEQIIKEDKFKDLLRDYLAQKISDEYHFKDMEGVLIKHEIRNLIKEEVETMIKEMVNEYYEMNDVKIMIEKEIESLSRNEIIELLKGNF